ncbi:zinc finger CCHC domain-containing protein, partial [Klebsiella pneumoniae]
MNKQLAESEAEKQLSKAQVGEQSSSSTFVLNQLSDRSKVRCFQCNELGHFANDCRKPKKKDKAYLELEAKYEALKKQTSKAYIAEGRCWDDTDSDEEEVEICNFALMAHSRDGESSSTNQVPTLITLDMSPDRSLDHFLAGGNWLLELDAPPGLDASSGELES